MRSSPSQNSMLKSAKHSKTVAAAERMRHSEAMESILTRRRRFLSLWRVELTMRGGRDLSRSVRAIDLDMVSVLRLYGCRAHRM